MNRILSLIALSCLLISLSACAEKKPPQQAALQGRLILSSIRELVQAYEKQDIGDFMGRVSRTYQDREAFEKTVASVFSKFETIRFTVQYTKMLIMIADKGNIQATFTWDGEWQAGGGNTRKDGGRVTLVFDPGEFKLLSIEGKNPFVPAEAQGSVQR